MSCQKMNELDNYQTNIWAKLENLLAKKMQTDSDIKRCLLQTTWIIMLF